MSATTKTMSTVAGLALAAVALSGCVVVEPAPSEADGKPKVSAPADPVPTEKPQPSETATPSESPEPTKSGGPIVDLEPETGTSYVQAMKPGGLLSPSKVVGPWLFQWHVDGDKVVYKEVLCTGTAAREATATLEGSGKDRTVRWVDNGDGEADDPWVGNAPTKTTRADVTDTTMRVGLLDTATTDVADEKSKFKQYCIDSGEDVAGYFK